MTGHILPLLTDYQIERLITVTRLGADKVAESMSKWLNAGITAGNAKAGIVHYSKLHELFADGHRLATGLIIGISGDISGYTVLIFNEDSTRHILSVILRHEINDLAEWDSIRRSVMEETGNILSASFINALVKHLDLDIHPSSPVMAFDLTSAIWDTVLTQYAIENGHSLICQATFKSGDDKMSGTFMIIPDNLQSWKSI